MVEKDDTQNVELESVCVVQVQEKKRREEKRREENKRRQGQDRKQEKLAGAKLSFRIGSAGAVSPSAYEQ